jgi:alpha/beta hydrolase family protein
MGRSPLSQLLLARRLEASGIRVHLFAYSTLRPFAVSLRRLVERVHALKGSEPFVLVGHSLGCVLIRASLPLLGEFQPSACFLLAPPNRVPRAARFFRQYALYRLLTRDAGRLLSDEAFMAALPVPPVPVKVYAGTAGYTGRRSPFRGEPNDGILAVSETLLSPTHTPMLVPVLHTFIMNSAVVASDIVATVDSLNVEATA